MAFSEVGQDSESPRTNGGVNGIVNGSVNSSANGNVNDGPNGSLHCNGTNSHSNGVSLSSEPIAASPLAATQTHDNLAPIAICGMALRLPGGLESPQHLWEFLLAKGDARSRVPESRYNISAYHSDSGKPGTIATQYG